MRRYDVVSGAIFILSIVVFALAAPVLVQEKRQACVDVVHIHKDLISVLGKRGDIVDTVNKFLEEFYKTLEQEAKPLNAHVLSSSVPSRPDHGSTSVVQAPPPNPGSSTASSKPLMEPSGPSAAAPMQGSWEIDRFNPACG